jgi:hypothetical protein
VLSARRSNDRHVVAMAVVAYFQTLELQCCICCHLCTSDVTKGTDRSVVILRHRPTRRSTWGVFHNYSSPSSENAASTRCNQRPTSVPANRNLPHHLGLQHAEDVESLTQPSLEIGLHAVSRHFLQTRDLLHAVARRGNLHLFNVRDLLFGAVLRILHVTFDLELFLYEGLEGIVIPPAVVIFSLGAAIEKVFDGGV